MSTESTRRIETNWQKFTLLAIALVGMLTMVVVESVDWSDVSLLFGAIVGYGTANGIGAAKGVSPVPVFRPANPQRRMTDISGPVLVVPNASGGVDVAPVDLDGGAVPADPYAD